VIRELKTWPGFFEEVWSGRKTAELRKDDRTPPYAERDVIHLLEYDPISGRFSGREIVARITHVVRNAPSFGLLPGFAMLSFEVEERCPAREEVAR
jgi:hypothetical protein